MPALTKDKLIKRVQTPVRVHPKSLSNTEVKRLGPSSRRISAKRLIHTQSIQTQTVLACLILNEKNKYMDEGTQTNDDLSSNSVSGFTSRLVKFFSGTIGSFMKFFQNSK